jgi:hypothetical protein
MLTASCLFADSGAQHKKRQARPVKMGTSGGNVKDFANGFCCSGTLGAVVKDGTGKFFVLSNNHVLGKSNTAHIGDAITQPGNIDVNCSPLSTDTVGTLSKFVKINFGANTNNKADAAIAAIATGKVATTGAILDIGNPGQPKAAAVNMHVKKSGRTTGLRRGIITAVNVTSVIAYPNSCGSSGHKVARFINQIAISDAQGGTAPPFIAGGDSGSLLVEDIGTCPATIGLLFAGDQAGNAIANRIQDVLTPLGNVKIVGCAAAASSEQADDANTLSMSHPKMIAASAVQSRYEEELFRIPGVVGVGIGLAADDSPDLAIVVFATKGSKAETSPIAVPSRLGQLPVRKIIAGDFVAF